MWWGTTDLTLGEEPAKPPTKDPHEQPIETARNPPHQGRHFAICLVLYLALTTYFVADWARSEAADFWPVWPLLGGGIGLAVQASP